ncbi:hypothetical protein SAMN04488564_10867 [Lentzea waywayandensis]|uniref:Uncharacterized protein n=1 Tax=Lentzea waywayandensis TaxID=84724 RepID=A0A1I6F4K3_9PSEU|nr:hypothetical protein [Lentzea waywayandensis]SFR24782.1 hypothetical protein SAMN04488564_10867 [Lentzea waywayandensis]
MRPRGPDVVVVDGSGAERGPALCSALGRNGLRAEAMSALDIKADPWACVLLLMPVDELPDDGHHVLSVVAGLRGRFRGRFVVAWHVPNRVRAKVAATAGNHAALLLGTSWQRELVRHATPFDAVRCRDRQVRELMSARRIGGKAVEGFLTDLDAVDPLALHDITAQVADHGDETRLFWPPPESIVEAVLLRSVPENAVVGGD